MHETSKCHKLYPNMEILREFGSHYEALMCVLRKCTKKKLSFDTENNFCRRLDLICQVSEIDGDDADAKVPLAFIRVTFYYKEKGSCQSQCLTVFVSWHFIYRWKIRFKNLISKREEKELYMMMRMWENIEVKNSKKFLLIFLQLFFGLNLLKN